MKNFLLKKWIPFFLLLAACNGSSTNSSIENFDPRPLDSLFDFYERQDLYFVSVELEKDGKLIYQRAMGHENFEKKKELDRNSVFLIGSITKTYTATMIMQLVEAGKLRLSDKLARFYPAIPNADKIDMEMLLRHRSGLFNYTSAEQFLSEVARPVSKEELLERFSRLEIVFTPGDRYQYSNTNYVLLGFILEEITGKNYGDLLNERILDKLNLRNTWYGRPDDLSHFALSYYYQGGTWMEVEPAWNTSWAVGAGAIAATVSDVSAFFKGLFAGKLVSEEYLRQMMDLEDGYGLGLAKIPFGTRTFYGHAGGIENYRSVCGYTPKDSILFTQISNAAINGNPNEVTIQLLNAVYGNEVAIPDTGKKEEIKVPVSILSTYEGTYSAPDFPLDIRIFTKNGTLYGQATGQPAFPLAAHSNTEFSFSQAAISMEFFKEDSTQKFHFRQRQNKRDFTRKPF